jgi:hypothetical protein
MWPFKAKKSKVDLAIEWLPRAIEVAKFEWLKFDAQPFAREFSLAQKIMVFTEGLGSGLGQWKAFKSSPPGMMLLIAAKGVQASGTYSKGEIERALCMALPE